MDTSKQPIAKASYAGEAVPGVGTPEYTAAQKLADEARRPIPGVATVTPSGAGKPFGSGPGSYSAFNSYGGIGAPTESDIRGKMLGEIQGQVDDIKNTYAGILGEVAVDNANRTGRTRSLAARSGTLGSDFGNTELANTDTANRKIMESKVAERDAKISSLINGVSQLASQKYEAEANRATIQEDKRLALLKDNQEQARKNLAMLGTEGHTIKDFSNDELQSYMNTTGLSEKEVEATLALNHKPADVVQSWAEGSKYYVISKDPLKGTYTTTAVDLPFTLPKKYTSAKIGDNTIAFYPENPDPKIPMEQQIKYYTIPGSKSTTETSEQKNDAYNALNWIRSQPDYKPEYEKQFNSDPVARSRAIQAYKDATKKKTTDQTP